MKNPTKNSLKIRNQVLLFDFDGTVVETEILAKKVIDVYFQGQKILNQFNFGDMIIGRTWKLATENMVACAKTQGVDLGDPHVLMEEFKERYREELKRGAALIPGFKEKVPILKEKARKIGIVTGSDREEVELILKSHGMEHVFDHAWCFGDYAQSKPHPSPYLTALKEWGVQADETIVFEDSVAGMESAHQAGLKWVQVAYESHALKPDPRSIMIIHDWTEIDFE